MRRVLILLGSTLPFVATSQSLTDTQQPNDLKKGYVAVGVSLGQGYRGTYPTITYASPRIQYFITDSWSIAAGGRYPVSNVYHQSGNKPDYTLPGVGKWYEV